MTRSGSMMEYEIADLEVALEHLKQLRETAAVDGRLTADDIDVLVHHVTATMGDYRIPDVPM